MLDEDPAFGKILIEKITTDTIDWRKFVTLCSNHLILPLIYLKFKSHDILTYLPEELAEHLKDIYNLNLARNNQILEQLKEITTILNRNNIYPTFLKGSGNLLDQLYADNGERILGDIDFLVSKKDYLATAKLLEEEGYAIFIPLYTEIDHLKHYPRISKPGYPAVLEIHQLPVTERFHSWFNSEIIYLEKKPVKSLPGCFVLSDKHNIILNFIHCQLDHDGHRYGVVSFRDLYDLYLLSTRTSLPEAINSIKTKKKAISYFAFARKAFGLNETFFPDSNFSAWLFTKKHDLNHQSVIFYHTHRTIVYIFHRIVIGFPRQIIQSFYSKEARKSVINRLSNRNWYRESLHTYYTFFVREK
jgi:hypothetical protein